MKIFGLLSIVILLFAACEKDNDQANLDYQYGIFTSENSKLLSKILLNNILYLELKYDSLDRPSELLIYTSDSVANREKYTYNSNNQLVERRYNNIIEYYNYENGLLIEKYSSNENNPDWTPKTIYLYDSDKKIRKADLYFKNNLVGYIEYDYDNKGNTVSRREYNIDNNETFLFSEYRCNFDNKINPLHFINLFPIDIMQKNNVIYSYSHIAIMSSMPPEYNSTFIYDEDGFPLEEIRIFKGHSSASEPQIYTYIYN